MPNTSDSKHEPKRQRSSRRDFLLRSAPLMALAGCSAPTASRTRAAPPLVGSQLYGWGQYYQRSGKDLTAHLDEVLSAIRDAGYDYAEGWLDVRDPSANLRYADRCRTRGLKPVSLYTGGRLHDEAAAETAARIVEAARACREAGYAVIVCNPDPIGRDKTDPELATQVAALKQIGAQLRAMDMHLGVHHHTPEMRNEAREFHYNFQNSPPGQVGFCYDVHWVHRGGLSPATVLPDYGDRIVTWHLRQSRQGIWWEDLDSGDIDYGFVAHRARARRIPRLLTVELAIEDGTRISRSVVENHRRSRDFVRAVFRT